jgi:predicted glycosyltransferase involved in capsule biosynthesis
MLVDVFQPLFLGLYIKLLLVSELFFEVVDCKQRLLEGSLYRVMYILLERESTVAKQSRVILARVVISFEKLRRRMVLSLFFDCWASLSLTWVSLATRSSS